MAADADPRPQAVYDSYPPSGQGLPKGWRRLGAGPARKADHRGRVRAGQPGRLTGGQIQAQSLYLNATSLRDITIGSNGSCGSYLCTAGTGYDGPTGLGVPNGVNAFK